MLRIELSPEIWLSMNSSRVDLRVREVLERRRPSVAWLGSLSPPFHVDERVEVAGPLDLLVPRLLRDRDLAERRAAGRRVEDPVDAERPRVAARERDLDGRPDRELVVLGVAVVDEGAVLAEVGEHVLRPVLPVDEDHLAQRRGLTAVAKMTSPKARTSPVRTFMTALTPGVSATASAASIGIGLKLFCAVSA